MKTEVPFYVVVLFVASLCNAKSPITELQGEWSGPFTAPDVVAFNNGSFALLCRDLLPPDCAAEIPPTNMKIVISESTIAISAETAQGATTPELAVSMFPACAAAGILPVEAAAAYPPAKIQSYDPTTGHLTFIDPRRPDDLNCLIVGAQQGDKVPSLAARSLGMFTGNLSTVIEVGLSFRCVVANELCVLEQNAEGGLVELLDLDFAVPCTGGACMES